MDMDTYIIDTPTPQAITDEYEKYIVNVDKADASLYKGHVYCHLQYHDIIVRKRTKRASAVKKLISAGYRLIESRWIPRDYSTITTFEKLIDVYDRTDNELYFHEFMKEYEFTRWAHDMSQKQWRERFNYSKYTVNRLCRGDLIYDTMRIQMVALTKQLQHFNLKQWV